MKMAIVININLTFNEYMSIINVTLKIMNNNFKIRLTENCVSLGLK